MPNKKDHPEMPLSGSEIGAMTLGRRDFMAVAALTTVGAGLLTLPDIALGNTPVRRAYVGSYTKDPPGGGHDIHMR